MREAETSAGGLGWATTSTMLYWQQRIAAALYSSLAQRVAARMARPQPRHVQDAPLPGPEADR